MTRATTPFGRFSGRRTHHGRPPVRAVWRAGLVLAVLATSLTGLIGPRPAGAVGETLAVSLLQVDGTPAWSADDVAGHDSGPTNGIVRANDNITYNVEISVNAGSAANTTFTVALAQGTEMTQVPAFCTGSGSALTPAALPEPVVPVTMTSWMALPVQTLVCNVGNRTANSTLTYPVVARVRPEVPNGTDLTPVSASVVTTSVTTPAVTNTVRARVSARAQFDLSKNAMSDIENAGYLNGSYGIVSCPDPLGGPGATRRCFRYESSVLISAPAGGKGVAPMAASTSFIDDVSPDSFYGTAVTGGAAWAAAGPDALAKYGVIVTGCSDVSYDTPGHKVGPAHTATGALLTPTNSVRDSGTVTCSQPGGPGTPATIDLTNADTTAYTYPTATPWPAGSVPADKAYVVSLAVVYLVPVDAVTDLGIESASGSTWTLAWDNKFTDFAPEGVDGTPNDPAANPAFNDHRASTSVVQAAGNFEKWFSGVPGATGNTFPDFVVGNDGWEGPAGSTGPQTGDGQLFPGATTLSTLYVGNFSTNGETISSLVCDSWDNTRLQLAAGDYPASTLGAIYQTQPSGGQAVWASGGSLDGVYGPPALTAEGLRVEYGTGAGGSGGASTCDDASSPDGWTTDPAAVPGNDPALAAQGVYTAVSRVRVHAAVPAPVTGNANQLSVTIALRSVATLPAGTVLPNWASVIQRPGTLTQEELLVIGGWSPNDYDPDANTGAIGDRLRIATATARLSKQVKDPGTGVFGTTTPQFTGGQTAEFKLQPTLSAGVETDVTTPVIVEDCLPQGQIFQATTSSPAASFVSVTVPAGSEITCGAGETYVRWNLGQQPINTPLAPITYSVRIANGATSGTKTNQALVTAQGDTSSVAKRTAEAAIQVVQPAGIKIDKIALTPLVEVNRSGEMTLDPLQWRVDLINLETTPGPSDVDIIDVLPKNGLSGTQFTGTLAFDSAAVVEGDEPGQAVEILYTKAATVHRDATDSSNDPSTGSTWCSRSGNTFTKVLGAGTSADCPASAAEVTGLRVRRPGVLDPSDLVSFSIDMIPSGNSAGDVYVNEAAGRATGLDLVVGPVDAPATVIASSIGNYVWDDANLNGIQDPGEAPIAGFTVHLEGTDSDGNPVGPLTTTTDANGRYSFTGLQSGDYRVTFAPGSLAADQHFTVQDVGGNDLVDSDGDPTTGVATVTLPANFDDTSVDQGVFTADPSIEITKFINGDDANTAPGVLVEPGNDMLVTFEVHNNGNMVLDPVVLTDDTIDAADITCPRTALDIDETMTCSAAYPAPAAGDQHTNVAAVTGTPVPLPDGTQLDDVTDDDPANAYGIVRQVDITKSIVGEPTPNGDGTFTVAYDVVVTNGGTQTAVYDLDDELHFGAGATVTGATVVSGPAGVALNAGWDGLIDVRIATGASIGVGVSHTYRVEATASLSTATSTTTSSDCELSGSETGTGFLNGATLTFDGDTTDAEACTEFPITTITKELAGAPVANGDGTTTVAYDIVVTNSGSAGDTYDLVDELRFGGNIDVVSAIVANTAPGTIASNGGWNGLANLVIVDGETIAAGDSHTYRVTVVATVDGAITLEESDCTTQAGETGTGFLNGATLTVNGIEANDEACAEAPNTSMTKELFGNPVVEADDSVTINYLITVKNTGAARDVYDLDDELSFGRDITVNTATVTNVAPGTITANTGWDGVTDLSVVADQAIGSGSTHTYLVTVNAKVGSETTISQGDCTTDQGETGTGFLNGATLTVNGETTVDDACGEVDPEIELSKALAGKPTANGDGTWTVDYDVTATNVGPAPGIYDLNDELRFGGGITVLSSEVTNVVPGSIDANDGWDGITDTQIVAGEPIGVGVVHRYRVTVTTSVAAELSQAASDCKKDQGEDGTGFLNGATLTYDETTVEDEACAPVPSISIVKTVKGAPTVSADGKVEVRYELVVTNNGAGDGTYDLSDELTWGAGLTVSTASVTGTPDGQAADPAWDGITELVIATKVPLAGGTSHTWEVTAIGQRSRSMTAESGDCERTQGEDGTGLLNTASVSANGAQADSKACRPIPPVTPVPPPAVIYKNASTGSLPRTGLAIGAMGAVGVGALLLGFGLVGGGRRRRRADA